MTRKYLIFACLSMLWITAVAWSEAQPKPKTTFTAVIPFEFAVGNRTLPAGTYTLEMALGAPTETDQLGILVVRSIDHTVYVAVVTDVASVLDLQPGSKAVFTRYGGRTFLSQVWEQGKSLGLQLHTSRSEPEFAQEREEREIVNLLPPASPTGPAMSRSSGSAMQLE